MTFKQRNTIILGSQTSLIVLVGAYLLLGYYPTKFENLKKEIDHCDQTLRDLQVREDYLAELNTKLAQNRELLTGWNKIVEANVTMGDILDYLNSIQARYGEFKFSLAYINDIQSTDFSYKVFTLTGEGDWQAIFALVWVLENGPKIFTIDRLELRGVETMEEDEEPPYYNRFKMVIPFSMQVKAIYSSAINVADLPVVNAANYIVQIPAGHNIFYPGIVHNLPPNEYGLLEVERAELRALLPGKAIVADHQGTLHSLIEGDPVYLGYLLRINQEQNTALFLLNKGGIVENFSLKLKLGSDPSQPEE